MDTGLVVGFERSRYLVREKRRWTQLCVIVSVPTEGFIGDVTFNLTVETRDGSASMSSKNRNNLLTMCKEREIIGAANNA